MKDVAAKYKEDAALNREALIDSTRTQESLKGVVESSNRLVEKVADRAIKSERKKR